MAGRRELARQLHALADIDTILGVMKNLALMETGKLSRILVAQREMVSSLEATATEFMQFYPPPEPADYASVDVTLVIGSQRGLCGDFNDLLVTALPLAERTNPKSLRISVGDKLAGRLKTDVHLSGPHAVEEIGQVLHTVMDAVSTLLTSSDGGHSLHLSALCHDPDNGVVAVRLLAPIISQIVVPEISTFFAPVLNIAPAAFFAHLAEQHLLAAITEVFHRSLMAESRFRLNHIEGASRRMERRATELMRKQTLARQEEIIEEIEAILTGIDEDGAHVVDVNPAFSPPAKPC